MNLRDCVLKDASQCELFLVQAGRIADAAVRTRDRLSHAVLSVEHSIRVTGVRRLDDLLDNGEIKSLIAALGVGIQLSRELDSPSFDIGKLRYHKIIIGADATPDGRRIRDQLVTYFHGWSPALIDRGHLFLCSIDLGSAASDEDLRACLMDPATRKLVPIRAGKTAVPYSRRRKDEAGNHEEPQACVNRYQRESSYRHNGERPGAQPTNACRYLYIA